MPLMRLRRLRSVLCRTIGGSLGSPPSLAGPVSMPGHRFLDRPSAGTMTAPASSFRAESPLQSSFADQLPRTILSDSRSCQGFVPFTTSPCASTAHGDSHFPLRSVLRRSQPLDVLLRALASRACSIPQPSRGFSFRGFFRDAATLPRRKELPPCRWLTARSPTKPGLESMSTGDGLGFGALLHITLRSLGSAVRPSEGSLPSSSLSPPGFGLSSPARLIRHVHS